MTIPGPDANIHDISERLQKSETSELDVEAYVSDVRHAYQDREIHYTGRRNDEQSLVADLLGEEADYYFDGALMTMFYVGESVVPQRDRLEVVVRQNLGSESFEKLNEMKSAYRQLVAALGIASLRMERDKIPTASGKPMRSLIELEPQQQHRVLEQLFSDFQELNALRFGAKGSGLMRKTYIDPFDEYSAYDIDKDVVASRRLHSHVLETAYRETHHQSELPAVHVAGKMSPKEYRELRRRYPDIDKAQFDRVVGYYQSARKYLEEQYSQ